MILFLIFFLFVILILISSIFKKQNLNLEKLKISEKIRVEKINPGLVLLKGVIDKEDQIRLCKYARSIGEGKQTKHSFFVNYQGKKTLNLGSRGRVYDYINNYKGGEQMIQFCKKLVLKGEKFQLKKEINFIKFLLKKINKSSIS
jgi:hypothetical protein